MFPKLLLLGLFCGIAAAIIYKIPINVFWKNIAWGVLAVFGLIGLYKILGPF